MLISIFTFRRRSPKKLGGCKARLSSPEAAEEKLNQEAFRLARTIRNLLHTSQQQPDLSRSLAGGGGGTGGGGGHRLCKTQLLSPPLLDAAPISPASKSNGNNTPTPTATSSAAEMLFLRANTMRDSRLSLRSSTDSSVHSTISSIASSSSKMETDEEITAIITPNGNSSNKQSKPAGNHNGSSTEDESGFSSISSFHDVGLPLSSTLIADCSSRNSTLKSALNVVGVPLSSNGGSSSLTTPSHSPSKTYRNASRYQRFSTLSSEDAAAVLWV